MAAAEGDDAPIAAFAVTKGGVVLKHIFLNAPPPEEATRGAGGGRGVDDGGEEEEDPPVRVGRHPDCRVLVDHPSVSRLHLELRCRRRQRLITVTDLCSVHGTWVSGQRIPPKTPVDLATGDTLRLGASKREYRLLWLSLREAFEMDDLLYMPSLPEEDKEEPHDKEPSSQLVPGHRDLVDMETHQISFVNLTVIKEATCSSEIRASNKLEQDDMVGCIDGGVRILSRCMVLPAAPLPTMMNSNHPPKAEAEEIHLTPWDLRLLCTDYIQKGIVLPKPLTPTSVDQLVTTLASSFARALRRFYPFAGRLAAQERGDGTVTVSLRCTGEGAEFVRAAAPGVAVADIASSLCTPPVVRSFFTFNQVLNGYAAFESLPVLSVQVTELADGVFIGMSMNHSVADGTTFWDFFNAWSEINRAGISDDDDGIPVLQRWFVETSPVPIPMPLSKLQRLLRPFDRPTVQECFFSFSASSVKKLKARANGEMASSRATATISSLQALLAHLWRAVCRARRLPAEHGTSYYLIVGCRGRIGGIPPGYVGNAVVRSEVRSTAGEIQKNGLGWTAWLLNRAVASFDEASIRDWLDRWVLETEFAHLLGSTRSDGTALTTGSSPRFNVFGNNFGWGKPVAVRSGSGQKMDGTATVFEGLDEGGSISLEVCVSPGVLRRLVADEEFMDAVTLPTGV